jgi:nucleotide-binding universal stress UspA family protein
MATRGCKFLRLPAENADLILMGSQGRGGIGKFLLGSVAEAVMRHATSSVEIVRMRGERHAWL